ncbi:TlpA family protein disulfide reductase [Chitinophaga defluvii]|uniref:TlpA disulfide reductase family protein n=1 Tax=Chitinophaga defluvii TaxID=3163343 RepID=A0ABV2TAV4_9BACT
MRCRIITLVFCIVLMVSSYAQEKSRRLFIGDKMPDVAFSEVINYPGTMRKLSDFKGKSIILDFWNKSCTNCIAAFPKMQQFQEKFKDDIQVLLIGYETTNELNKLFQNSPIVKNTTLPMILGKNQDLRMLFPHMGEPYAVWIDKNGIVKATTNGTAATSENIQDLIAGRPLKVPIREDLIGFDLDSYSSLLTINNGMFLKDLLYYTKISSSNLGFSPMDSSDRGEWEDGEAGLSSKYYSLIMRKIKGYNKVGISLLLDSITKKQKGFIFIQQSVPLLYANAYNVPEGTRVVIDNGGAEYYDPRDSTSLYRNKWAENYTFIYAASIPYYDAERFRYIMREDLKRFFGMNGRLEVRPIPHVILFRTNKDDRLKTKGGDSVYEDTGTEKGKIFNNCIFQRFVISFRGNYLKREDPIFVDETHISPEKKIDMILKSSFKDVQAMNKELEKYGLGVKEEVRKVEVLVLEKEI